MRAEGVKPISQLPARSCSADDMQEPILGCCSSAHGPQLRAAVLQDLQAVLQCIACFLCLGCELPFGTVMQAWKVLQHAHWQAGQKAASAPPQHLACLCVQQHVHSPGGEDAVCKVLRLQLAVSDAPLRDNCKA